MHTRTLICAIVTVTLATSGFAFAQGRGDRDDRGRNDQRGDQRDRRDNDSRKGDRPGERMHQDQRDFGRAHNDDKRWTRGAGPSHQFYRGGRLPAEYRHRNYVVNDWRGHRLSAPPRGHHWVQTGSDYVLVAIATGIILQLLLVN